jgi:hypothetical protein
MTAIRQILRLPLAVAVIGLGSIAAQAGDMNAYESRAEDRAAKVAWNWGFPDRIEGLWTAEVFFMPCGMQPPPVPAFEAMALFGRGGTFHDENSVNPVMPPPNQALRSSAFGRWSHVWGKTYEFAFRFYRFDTVGTLLGTTVVRHTLTLSRDANSYTSNGAAEFYDATGQLFTPPGPPICSTSTATRFL